MSVDFSQFFNGPIRDSLIAQVSGYLDIPRPQATVAYDKAVALVIGAMALQAGKPEGAQELAAHIRDSQTQANLTSSALSPTVLTNDQFAQIVTVGEREQGTILGAQLEPVASHLEVATGLDRTAVGSLLSVIVPFVLSYLKNNITTENSAADKLPALLAAQAPHVAPQLDAPALAALGGERLEDVFGPEVNVSADAHSAPAAEQDRGASSSSANANERTKGGWFKWVLTLAVILAGVAWVKSCTQSDTAVTENAEPATQDQSATPVPTPEATPAETAPAEAAPTEGAPTEGAPTEGAPTGSQSPATEGDTSTSDAGAAESQGGADAPAAHFPEPVPAPNGDASAASVKNSTPTESTDSATSTSATQASAAPEESGADTSADKSAANTDKAATAAATAADNPASASDISSDQTTGDQTDNVQTDNVQTDNGKNAAESAPEASQSGHTEDSTTTEPTSGPASDSMETESAPASGSDAGADATTPAAQSNQSAAPAAGTESAGKTTTFADATATAATAAANNATDSSAADSSAADSNAADSNAADSNAADSNAADSNAADSSADAPVESSGKTTTFAVPAEPEAGGGKEHVAPQNSPTPADQNEPQATHSDASTSTSTTEVGVPGKTTTFGEAVQPPESTDASQPGAETMSSAETPATNDQTAAQLRLQREGDALKVSGTVPNESVHTRIVNALKLVDGHSRIEDDIKIDSQTIAIPFEDYSGLLSLLRGYHDVNMNLENDALTLTGQVTSQEEKDTLTSRAQSLVGSSIQVHNQAEVVAPAQAKGTAVAPAQVLFASGSAEVDNRFHDALDRLAQQLNENGKRVRLVGFADESGTTPLNEVLSKRRAESVKAYLILRGVPADRIQTEGQGVQAPVADNATQEGRAQNRRVEFHEE